MKEIFKKAYRHFLGKKKYQFFFEKLHKIALYGMNIGLGGSPQSSGEVHALHYIKKKLSKTDPFIIFDVGANTGQFAKLSNDVFPNAQIFSFEPSYQYFKELDFNTAELSNISTYNLGFGNEPNNSTLYRYSNKLFASLYNRKLDHFEIEIEGVEQVVIDTVDDFCENNSVENIHLLKIDVEGHEFKVLQGAKRMINAGKIDFIQFEFGGTNIDAGTYFQNFYYFLNDQYRIYRILKDGLREITKYDEWQEVLILTNFLAEKK